MAVVTAYLPGAIAVVSVNKSNGCLNMATTCPLSHSQFDSTQLSKRHFWRSSCRSKAVGRCAQLDELHAFFHVGFLCVLAPVDLALTAGMLFTPLVRYFFEERRINEAVELVDVHRVDPILKPLVSGLMAFNCLFLLPAPVGVAGRRAEAFNMDVVF